MKKQIIMASILIFMGGFAAADSLDVNHTAALGGTGTACSGGNCGLELIHDNTSKAYVTDDTPTAETVYRAEFLFDPNSIGDGASKFRQAIFGLYSFTPDNPTYCPTTVRISAFRIFIVWKNGVYYLQSRVRGNLCGERATLPRVLTLPDEPQKICCELEFGNSLTGRAAIALVDPASPCPTTGDAAWAVRSVTNGALVGVDQARLGNIGTNNFAAGENGSMYFDEFASYRTLTP